MKKIFYLLPSLILALSACTENNQTIEEAIEYFPVKEDTDGKWGFINKNGEMLFTDEFKNEPSVIVNGVFYVKEGNNFVLYRADKKPEAIPGCDELVDAGYFMEGLIPVVKKDERISIRNGQGDIVATLNPVNGKEILSAYPYFSNGLLPVINEDYKYGFVNTKGEVAIDLKYNDAWPFSEGLALVSKEKDGSPIYSIINKDGLEEISFKKTYSPISFGFKGGHIIMREDDRVLVFDKKGEFFKLPGKVDMVDEYNADYLVYISNEGKYGLMKLDEKDPAILIKPKYDYMTLVGHDKVLVSEDNDYELLTVEGDRITDFNDDYNFVNTLPGSSSSFRVYDGNYYFLIGEDGKPLNKKEFKDMTIYAYGDYIHSHYFNTDGFVADMLANVTDNGIGKYYIGEAASKLGFQAKDVTGNSTFSNTTLEKQGAQYSISFKGQCSANMAYAEYDYSYYYYGDRYNYYFNPNSQVVSLMLHGSVPGGHWDSIKAKLISGLEAKGFKKQQESNNGGENMVYFTNSKVGLVIGTNDSDGSYILLGVASLNHINNEMKSK